MTVLTKEDIERLLAEGELVCRPEGKINPNSIDVSLHSVFFRAKLTFDPVYPYAQSTSESIWELQPAILIEHDGKKVITIDPGEVILATTEQFIGARSRYTTMLKSKSTTGRNCLDVCGSAGWGDPGYIDRWAFPLRNNGLRTVFLQPGTWIAQIVFFEVSTPTEGYSKTGSYQSTDDIDELIKNWNPKDVLPKPMKTR